MPLHLNAAKTNSIFRSMNREKCCIFFTLFLFFFVVCVCVYICFFSVFNTTKPTWCKRRVNTSYSTISNNFNIQNGSWIILGGVWPREAAIDDRDDDDDDDEMVFKGIGLFCAVGEARRSTHLFWKWFFMSSIYITLYAVIVVVVVDNTTFDAAAAASGALCLWQDGYLNCEILVLLPFFSCFSFYIDIPF